MALIYRCDICKKKKKGTAIPGIYAEICDCLPMNWAICVKERVAKILCGGCYTEHKHR